MNAYRARKSLANMGLRSSSFAATNALKSSDGLLFSSIWPRYLSAASVPATWDPEAFGKRERSMRLGMGPASRSWSRKLVYDVKDTSGGVGGLVLVAMEASAKFRILPDLTQRTRTLQQ